MEGDVSGTEGFATSSRKRSLVVLGLALAVAISLVVVATAGAAATPPFEPDPSSLGGLRFFDAAGNEITSGNVADAPFAAYVQASGAGRVGDTKATLYADPPKSGVPISGWSGEQMTASAELPQQLGARGAGRVRRCPSSASHRSTST